MEASHSISATPFAQNDSGNSLADNADSARPDLSELGHGQEDEACHAICTEPKIAADSADFNPEEQRVADESNSAADVM